VDGVDLTVAPGTVLGLLGPNGAGKTTVVRMLATLLRPDGGHARVAGFDVVRDADRVRELIGLTGQYAAVDEDLTGYENLLLIGRLREMTRRRPGPAPTSCWNASTWPRPGGGRRRRTQGYAAAARPGGQHDLHPGHPVPRRADHRPRPRSRGDVWKMVRELVADGTTVLLTTQYLDEADGWPTRSRSSTTAR